MPITKNDIFQYKIKETIMSNKDDIVIVSGVRTLFSKESLKRAGHILMTMMSEFERRGCGYWVCGIWGRLL
jgi:hypothetical protein